jgi:hypothetical protein
VKPYQLGRQLSAASDLPDHSYGLFVMPRSFGQQQGLLVGITWSTTDSEQVGSFLGGGG